MKTASRVIAVLLLLGITLITGQLAFGVGSCEVSTGDLPLTIDPNAPGTKVPGTLTIYYDITDSNPDTSGCTVAKANMFYFFRFKKNSPQDASPESLYGFSGVKTDICLEAIRTQEAELTNFVKNHIVRVLFGNTNLPVALKSVNQIVEDDQGNLFGSPYFYMLDLVIAVQE